MTLPIPNPTGNVSTQKIKSSWVNNLWANTYVAPYGLLFFDTYDGVLRLGDNVTPGGQIINTGGGGGNTNYTDANVISLLSGGTLTTDIITSGNVDGGNVVATYLWGDGSNITGISVTPAAPVNSIQFNSANTFGGSANLTFDAGTGVLSLTGTATVTGNVDVTGNITATANVHANTVVDNFGIFLNANVIAGDFTIPSGYNGISGGPMVIGSNVVTVPDGQRWTVV